MSPYAPLIMPAIFLSIGLAFSYGSAFRDWVRERKRQRQLSSPR
jgi:hypothetical protein